MTHRLKTLLDPLALLGGLLRRLGRERDGNVMILFAMAAIPVIIGAGIAIDAARAYMVKIRLAAALDAAALAVGSQTSTSSSTLTTDLNNYFFDNYCKAVPSGSAVTSCASTVATENNISVQATTTITNATVTYTASASVPTTFMHLVGVTTIPITVKAQTTKFPGMEIAVVLDNTGSMLCGQNETNSYGQQTQSACATGEVTSDTDCTNTSDLSRICTLRRAALDFISTLQGAITAPQSIYMSIVPFVTTVNVGDNSVYGSTNNGLCASGGSCSGIATDPTSGDFTDLRGNILPVIPITANTTSGSTSVSSVKFYSAQTGSYISGSVPIQQGMNIYGHGIPSGTTISSVSGTSITLSQSANLTFTGNSLAVGPPSGNLSAPYTDPTTFTTTGSWTSGRNTLTVASTTGIAVGMVITSTSSGIPTTSATTVSSISGTTVTMSASASVTQSNKSVTFSLAGSATSGSTTISSLKGTTASLNSIVVGMGISGTGIPANAYVTGTTGTPPTSLTISSALTSSKSGDILTLTNLGATTTTGSQTVTNASFSTVPSVGDVLVGNGIPANTTITAVTGTAANFAVGTGQLTISQSAVKPSNFSSSTGTCCNTTLVDVTPITYDSAYNTASPSGSSTTQNWGGCVMEPTSSDENASSSSTGVLNSATTDPDTSEPVSTTKWYPFYWAPTSANNWPSVAAQNYTTEPLSTEVASWISEPGPNQGCPAPILALTDMTTAAGVSTLQNAVNSMWPKDAGGTQVHVGAIWGWRVLSPNGPFTANNGHPLSYSEASSTGWKKIMVLMTDGEENAPSGDDLTGTGEFTDGKLGTTSNSSTANTNLQNRLATVCSGMAADGVLIYTIGLGSEAPSNAQLQSCPANGGRYYTATTGNVDQVFQSIAASIIHLRLTE